ncbi:restriction alleviation protein, Lar family [Serratia proteamaculans]|uniref:Lar family restriction alleviation protein n=1 Tax=Serratia proteamaculans TaxID=28151 RepID=UPI00217C4758|nr:Lar family restriction alleviation protein [Serratia proteamaculans]CAI1579231.1 restriction alleviation protein, Lar family [Serratia proteamaculans]
MANELKPCPFCGGLPTEPQNVALYYNPAVWETRCKSCQLIMRGKTKKALIEAWSHRTEEAQHG